MPAPAAIRSSMTEIRSTPAQTKSNDRAFTYLRARRFFTPAMRLLVNDSRYLVSDGRLTKV
jgi:hypothetical protein